MNYLRPRKRLAYVTLFPLLRHLFEILYDIRAFKVRSKFPLWFNVYVFLADINMHAFKFPKTKRMEYTFTYLVLLLNFTDGTRVLSLTCHGILCCVYSGVQFRFPFGNTNPASFKSLRMSMSRWSVISLAIFSVSYGSNTDALPVEGCQGRGSRCNTPLDVDPFSKWGLLRYGDYRGTQKSLWFDPRHSYRSVRSLRWRAHSPTDMCGTDEESWLTMYWLSANIVQHHRPRLCYQRLVHNVNRLSSWCKIRWAQGSRPILPFCFFVVFSLAGNFVPGFGEPVLCERARSW